MLVAPGRPPGEGACRLAVERLEARGYRVVIPEGFYDRRGYLDPGDEVRAAEINQAFADPEVDAIFPVTGGFGTTRILDRIDYRAIQSNPKIFIGFSDITALHLAIARHTDLVTFHSPNPEWGLGSAAGMDPGAERCFWRALTGGNGAEEQPGGGYMVDPAVEYPEGEGAGEGAMRTVVSGRATGVVVGGNLAVIAALMGTPHEIQTAGKILFFEDVNEAPYRVDRILTTLKAAGKLDDLAGVLIGRFTKVEVDPDDGYTMDNVFDDFFGDAPYPVLANFPAGHVVDNLTLPLGVPAELDADARTLRFLIEPTGPRRHR